MSFVCFSGLVVNLVVIVWWSGMWVTIWDEKEWNWENGSVGARKDWIFRGRDIEDWKWGFYLNCSRDDYVDRFFCMSEVSVKTMKLSTSGMGQHGHEGACCSFLSHAYFSFPFCPFFFWYSFSVMLFWFFALGILFSSSFELFMREFVVFLEGLCFSVCVQDKDSLLAG